MFERRERPQDRRAALVSDQTIGLHGERVVNSVKPFLLLISVGLLGGCGSDSSSDEDTADSPPEMLSTYNFEIGGLQAGTDMTVDVGGQFQIGIELDNTLRGSVDLRVDEPDAFGFLDFVTDAGSSMTVTVSGTNTDLDGEFTVNVTSDVADHFRAVMPISGDFEVVTRTEAVTVTVVTADLFPVGVEMSLNGAAATYFSWDEYNGLLDDLQAETWQRRASVAGLTLSFVIDRMFQISRLLDSLEQTESATQIVTACDEFQGTPPAGVLLQGDHVLTRLGSGEDLSPGDVFDWTFTNCWFASSNSLIDNVLQLQNYIEVIDSSNTLTRIGFGPTDNVSGGVLYFDWRIAETEENQGVYTIDPASQIEVNGGFSLLLTQP
jgi:hypothetical protein